jgi:hypothetical protein
MSTANARGLDARTRGRSRIGRTHGIPLQQPGDLAGTLEDGACAASRLDDLTCAEHVARRGELAADADLAGAFRRAQQASRQLRALGDVAMGRRAARIALHDHDDRGGSRENGGAEADDVRAPSRCERCDRRSSGRSRLRGHARDDTILDRGPRFVGDARGEISFRLGDERSETRCMASIAHVRPPRFASVGSSPSIASSSRRA